ncbi:MAG: FxLYD domain-containing protein [Actinomycetota bacterium]|nr:FxLYD domain-containing protein [Actinomycetota bacterium]
MLLLGMVACGGADDGETKETLTVTVTAPATATATVSPTPTQAAPQALPTGPGPHLLKVDLCKQEGIEVIASGTITNQSPEPKAYSVEVEFLDKGGARIEKGIDFIGTVQPGQTARWQQDNYTKSEYRLGDCKAKAL